MNKPKIFIVRWNKGAIRVNVEGFFSMPQRTCINKFLTLAKKHCTEEQRLALLADLEKIKANPSRDTVCSRITKSIEKIQGQKWGQAKIPTAKKTVKAKINPQYLPVPIEKLNDIWQEIRYKVEFAQNYVPCREILVKILQTQQTPPKEKSLAEILNSLAAQANEAELYERLIQFKKIEILDAFKQIFSTTPSRGYLKTKELLCKHLAMRIIFRAKMKHSA